MDPQDDPEARIKALEQPLADTARATELGTTPYTGKGTYLPPQGPPAPPMPPQAPAPDYGQYTPPGAPYTTAGRAIHTAGLSIHTAGLRCPVDPAAAEDIGGHSVGGARDRCRGLHGRCRRRRGLHVE